MSFARPNAGPRKLLHGLAREFGSGTVAADYEHQDALLIRIAWRHVLETADCGGRKGNDVERIEVDMLDLAALGFRRRPRR
jgi:hypothetical protein